MNKATSEDITVLVVENNVLQGTYLQYILEQHGYKVSVVHSGREALASMKSHKPSVVISDFILPGMRGDELCSCIKEDENLRDTPVILLPQLSDSEDAVKCLECGADRLVAKPYREEFLFSCIHNVLANHKPQKASAMKEEFDILLKGTSYSITSDKSQIVDFLLSTYEAAAQKSRELERVNQELKRALDATRAFERNYRKFLEIQSDAAVIVDRERVIRFVNPVAESLFGRKLEEMLGDLFSFPLVVGESREISIAQDDGKQILAEMRVMEIYWEGENSYLAYLRDITENKRVAEALKDSEERYQELFDNASDLIQSFTPDGRFLYVNHAWQDTLGYAEEEIADISLFDIIHSDSRGHFKQILQKAVSGERVGKFRTTFVTKNGGEIIVEGSINCKSVNGKTAVARGIFRNITVNTLAEETLREGVKREAQAYAQGRLEVVDTILHNIGNAINSVAIGIGTIQEDLVNNRLTRRLLSLANAVKEHQGDFGNYVKNDSQGQKVAPFIVALAGDFVQRDEELARTVKRVHERAEHIADIIRTEKTLSKRSVYSKEICLRESIDDAIIVLQDTMKKRNISVSIDCAGAPKEISTQESQFHQMLVNLVKNSIEAIDELGILSDSPFIQIKCYTESDLFFLEVADNGIGIEKGKLEVIFRPGYTTKNSGSGLGLHSIANFVKGCGGQIIALSDGIGRGATMRVTLPLH